MNIRIFQYDDDDYAARLALERAVTPEEQPSIAWMRQEDEAFAADNAHTVVRVLGELDGQIIASGKYWHAVNENDRQFQFDFIVHPAHQAGPFAAQMHDYLLSRIHEQSPETISSEAKEDERYRTQLLAQSGLEPMMRFPCSQQDVTAFDFTRYGDIFSQLASAGIEFVTLTDVMTSDPDWQRNVWRMFIQIEQDVPMPNPTESTPFEVYVQYYEGDNFRSDSWSIAIDSQQTGQQRYVGMSVVNIMPTRPDTLYAGITGVIPAYRRRKIATALKVCSTKYACENGYRYIYTDNEEDNPMLTLNLSLGFELLPAWVYYKQRLI